MARLATLRPRLATADTRAARPPAKQVDQHYNSPEHATWRKAVIARAAGRCQGPACGRTGTRLYADHIVELRDGGSPFDPANGQALCGACHTRKTAAARAARQAR